MSEQTPPFKGRALFGGHDTSFGIFYPTDFLIAVLDSHETAQRVKDTLSAAGYGEDEVDAVPSQYVVSDIEQGTQNVSWLKRLEQHISKAVGTESRYWEQDIERAREGAGFLAVYCPSEHEAQRVLRLLKPHNPTAVRRYLKLAIEEYV